MRNELAKDQGIGSRRPPVARVVSLLLMGAALAALASLAIWDPRYYPLFHSVADMGTVFVAGSVFLVVWHGRRHLDNDYYLFVAIAFLSFALLDFMHLVGNKGMGVFPDYGNLGPTFYIASRYVLAISFLLAPLFIKRKVSAAPVFAVHLLVVALVLLSVLYWRNFPATYIEGVGLTPFKIWSDYVVCLMLLGGLGLLLLNRRVFDARVLKLIALALVLSIASGLAFTLYADPFGITNAGGHLFQIASFCLVYLAFVQTALTNPQNILYRALRDGEERLRLFIEHAPASLAMLDRQMRYLSVSRRWLSDYGLGGSDIIGLSHYDVFPGIPERWREIHRRALAGEVVRAEEDPFERADRSTQWLRWEVRPWHSAGGQVAGIVIFTEDITERRRQQEELAQAKAALERANAAKDQFIATLSHELRTPLTPVVAAAGSLLEDHRLPEEAREDLEMIRRNAALEVALINDLLDVTRIASGKLVLDKRPLDAAQVLRDAARICSVDLDGRSQTLTIETPDAPYPMEADPARLHQVFWNLIKNAIKFTPHGGRIAVQAAAHSTTQGRTLRVMVHDTGVGIEPHLLPHIFDRFEQGGGSTTRQFGGLGLGLAIAKAVCEMHGGAITAHSPGKDQGATFVVELPLPAADLTLPSGSGSDSTTSSATDGARTAASSHLSLAAPMRVLLVEDHADTAKLLSRLLSAKGHHVTRADSVHMALAEAQQNRFDLLISDLGLPDGTGYDLLRQLLASGKPIPAIALSGYGTAADIQKSREAGFAEHLIKPVDLANLRAALIRVATAPPVAD